MSEMAKKARAAMKAKAKSITTDPHQKVDSSTWTPPEPLNTEAKTGMRPVSRRAYKKGGKVEGVNAKANMGKKPRASGGKTMANDWINRNAKEANEERPGVKHVGGMKKGGRAAHATRGTVGAKMLNKLTTPEYRNALEGNEPQPSDLYDADQLKDLEQGYNTPKIPTYSIKDMKPVSERDAISSSLKDVGNRLKGEYDRYPTDKSPEPGMKKGGRAKRMDGGMMPPPAGMAQPMDPRLNIVKPKAMNFTNNPVVPGQKKGGKVEKNSSRSKKNNGGSMEMLKKIATNTDPRDNLQAKLKDPRALDTLNFQTDWGEMPGKWVPMPVTPWEGSGKKRGGKIKKHDDVKEDKALIRKMVKPSARTGKLGGGPLSDPAFMQGMTAMRAHAANRKNGGDAEKKEKKSEKSEKREKRATGGGIFSGPSYPGKIPGVTGGRIARATGGKTKGKTDINIIINGGGKGQDDMQGMPGMPRPIGPAGGMPLAPPPGPMQPPAGGPPMPPMPAGGPPGMPPGMMPPGMPLPRKSGGRAYHSYKDMDAGAGSGEGRLEKTEIAKFKRGQRKAGGRTYRSYKDMDAGAASGLGRLEKTEIAAHKK